MIDGITEFAVFSILIFVFAIIFAAMGIKMVPQGYEYTLERFGRYLRVLRPGLHFIIPIMDRIGRKVLRHLITNKIFLKLRINILKIHTSIDGLKSIKMGF